MLDPLVIVRTLHFAACTAAMGTLAFALLTAATARHTELADHAALQRQYRAGALAALLIAGATGAVWLMLIAGNILGVAPGDVFGDGGITAVALDTRFGQIACLRLMLTVAAVALVVWHGPGWPALVIAAALMGLIAPTGHAGAATGAAGWVHLLSDVVHLLSAGFWLGALPALVGLLLWSRTVPARAGLATEVTRRFSTLALAAVVALLLSGIVNTAILVGWPADPFATTYGRALGLKVVIFAAMLALAAVNRFRITPRLPQSGAVRLLAATAAAETALGLGTLLLVGLLGTLPPAGHVHSSPAAVNPDAAFVHIHTSEVMADLAIQPGRAGPVRATILLWHEDYRPYLADRVTLTLETRDSGGRTLAVEAVQDSDGAWSTDGLRIPVGGSWTARLTVERGGNTAVLDATVVLAQCSIEC